MRCISFLGCLVTVGRVHLGCASTVATQNLRLNHIQVIGTHNSYHREVSLAERPVFERLMPSWQNYYYSHSKLSDQLSHQGIRSLELDLHSDTKGGLYANPLIWKLANLTKKPDPEMLKPGIKVLHVTDLDPGTICKTFVECLKQLKAWSDAHPRHLPITVDLELKDDDFLSIIGGIKAENWTLDRLLEVDQEIRSVLASKLITPDDVRQKNLTLEESVLKNGWPSLDRSRGKFLFYFDNDPNRNDPNNPRNIYRSGGHSSLEGRAVFTNAIEGDADAAVIKYNDPTNTADMHRLLKKGYLLRTRADEPIDTVLSGNFSQRRLAFESGAQIVSTDFPAYGMAARWDTDYAVTLTDGLVARCNPVTAPRTCKNFLVQ